MRVYCNEGLDPRDIIAAIRDTQGVEGAYAKSETVEKFELPADREGDVAVVSDAGTCIGAREEDHDLSALKGHRLRTHGGISEATVPIVISHPVTEPYAARAQAGGLRSHEVFDFAINGTAA